MEELISYYKEIIKQLLKVSKADYELERQYMASTLRRMGKREYDVPPHPFVDM